MTTTSVVPSDPTSTNEDLNTAGEKYTSDTVLTAPKKGKNDYFYAIN